MSGKRGRRPTAAKSRSERLMPCLSPRREREEIQRMAEDWSRKQLGKPPLPTMEKRHSEVESMNLARLCMRFLWWREYVLEGRESIEADLDRFVDEWRQRDNRPAGGDWEGLHARLYSYLVKKQKVRLLRPGEQPRDGELVERYRAWDLGSDGPTIIVVLKI